MAIILDNRAGDSLLDVSREETGTNFAPSSNATVRVKTARFGTLDVDQELMLTFAEGLIGFETCTRFFVVHHEAGSSFRWLQSADSPTVAFPIMEPVTVRPDYAPTISDTDARQLALSRETPTLLFSIITVPPHSPRDMTINLLGPIVINGLTRQGKQVIVLDEGLTTRHSVVGELARATALQERKAA